MPDAIKEVRVTAITDALASGVGIVLMFWILIILKHSKRALQKLVRNVSRATYLSPRQQGLTVGTAYQQESTRGDKKNERSTHQAT